MADLPAGPEISTLMKLLARLPGLGPRSARRVGLHLLKNRDTLMAPLAAALSEAADRIVTCEVCGTLDVQSPCAICADPERDPSVLCVVQDVGDLWAFERGGIFKGRYHVLGGVLSALDGIGPEELRVGSLVARANDAAVSEVILALNPTVDGQTTAHFLKEALEDADVTVSFLAQGIPVGGELDYLDDGTLAAALKARR